MSEALSHAGALGEAAELHGQLCGLACLLGMDAGPPWVAEALQDCQVSGPARDSAADALKQLADGTLESLDSGDMSLELLLPDDVIMSGAIIIDSSSDMDGTITIQGKTITLDATAMVRGDDDGIADNLRLVAVDSVTIEAGAVIGDPDGAGPMTAGGLTWHLRRREGLSFFTGAMGPGLKMAPSLGRGQLER